MKTSLIYILFLAVLAAGCSSRKAADAHYDGDGHDHSQHDHSAEGGHDHPLSEDHDHEAENSSETHTDGILFTDEQAAAVGLQTYTVEPTIFRSVIKTSGQVQSSQGDEATIVATTSGVVNFANPSIADGTPVRAGESVVTISARNLQEGDPSVKAKIEFESAEREFRRAESLIKDTIISRREFEQARARFENAESVYGAQAANVTPQGVRVTSPISGFIKNRLVSQGEYVSVGQPIATISQNRRLQLRAEVSERYFSELPRISGANFRMSYGDTVYMLSELNGKLLSYGKASDGASFYVPVTFEFDNVGDIVPGSFAEIYLLSSPMEKVLTVPVSAITEEQGLTFVYLQIAPEEYRKQEVQLGASDGDRALVLSGLSEGDKVVTKGVYQVKLAAISSVMPEGHTH